MFFKIGYNPSGGLFVDKTHPEDIQDAKLVLNRKQLVQLQQSINFALAYHQPPNNPNLRELESSAALEVQKQTN